MALPFLKSPMGNDPIRIEAHIKAPVQKVFNAWTDPNELLQWFGPKKTKLQSAQIDLVEGGIWEFCYEPQNGQYNTLRGKYVEILQDQSLVFTWTHERGLVDGQIETSAESLVSIKFSATADGTSLNLMHEAIVTESGRLGVCNGWSSTFEELLTWLQNEPLE